MAIYRNRSWVVERPHVATFLLLAANVIVFGLCLPTANGTAIPPEVLFANGAMYSQAMERHEYWRLIAYAFLHADPLHLAGNMFCLVLWGGPLEKRIGSFYFLVIYFCAMIAAAITSDLHHLQPYLTVGASGAISGILGALLCLWILGKIDLSAQFFLMNIGLNAALALSSPQIDWVAHVGGFAAGLIVCAVIDILERVNGFILRCKFPEFVKINGAVLCAMLGVLMWNHKPEIPAPGSSEGWLSLFSYSALCLALFLAAIKLVDIVLSVKKGLAIIVVMFSLANAGLTLLAVKVDALPGLSCASPPHGGEGFVAKLINLVCADWQMTIGIATACAFAATLVLYAQELMRGIGDVGFIGGSLRAERKRRQGI
jgi:membrane associated rhomboid family serine protease